MADRIKPHLVKKVARIRKWEADMKLQEAKDIAFIKYHNYYAPENVVKDSKNVLTFGVGGECKFEKLILHENTRLNIHMFDPTPFTCKNIGWIKYKSASRNINDSVRNKFLSTKIKYSPIGYGPSNSTLNFYYDPKKEPFTQRRIIKNYMQSFSLIKTHENCESVSVPVNNLRGIMDNLALKKVDIVKADIEGMWPEMCNEIVDNKIDIKMLATEFELIFDDLETALGKATKAIEKFTHFGYTPVINRRREKLMLEMLFIRKDIYAG